MSDVNCAEGSHGGNQHPLDRIMTVKDPLHCKKHHEWMAIRLYMSIAAVKLKHSLEQVFRVEAHEETSQKFPLTCHLRKAAATTIPHVRMLLGLSDSGAQDLSSVFQVSP